MKFIKFLFVLYITQLSHADIVGLLVVGDASKAGIAAEKQNGEIHLLLVTSNNSEKYEFGFSPGTPFSTHIVAESDGERYVLLSVMINTKKLNSPNVNFIEGSSDRTLQSINLSQDIKTLESMKLLIDKDGMSFAANELTGVVLAYHNADGDLKYVPIKFKEIAEGKILQVIGEEVRKVL